MPSLRQTAVPMWKHQADAVLSQVNPVSGTKYTVLATVKNARIISIVVSCVWTVQPTPLEIHVTIDGVAQIYTFTDPVSTTNYCAELTPTVSETTQELATLASYSYAHASKSFLLEGKSVKIEVETTGGTVSNLSARVKHALRR